ncbi:MAG: Two component regulator three Y domain-containing protein [Candidatus Dormibacteraeota bacterium]|nr:Two component regulator three Y domain-containing protein [Candidatus Dormibacteraeota bacterium]
MTVSREQWAAQVQDHRDEEGRVFRYVHVRHPGSRGLVVHFSAFFGEWGDARAYRKVFSGHFHRLRMLGEVTDHDWLFVCDEYGADDNGTYYSGHAGDRFVERAMLALIMSIAGSSGVDASSIVTVGSSMGATGALKFGLLLGVKGIVAISPHIDLDICAVRQGRWRHVAYICPDGDPVAAYNEIYTRQIRHLVVDRPAGSLPQLFVQSCRDDDGVFSEQVEPLCREWRARGGAVALDARARGGHTSDHATKPLLLDVITRLLDGDAIDVRRYQRDRRFRGSAASVGLVRRLRSTGGRALRRAGLRRRPEEPDGGTEDRMPSEPSIQG